MPRVSRPSRAPANVPTVPVRRVSISSIAPHPDNPRRIEARAAEVLRASLKRFGLVQSVVVNQRTGRVVGGHQRVEQLRALGETEVDAHVVDLDENAERALMVQLNDSASQGAWNDDRLAAVVAAVRNLDVELVRDLAIERHAPPSHVPVPEPSGGRAKTGSDTGLVAPFPWFGGKRRVAKEVWSRLGDVAVYAEPFFGSGAVLLGRPGWTPSSTAIETVNDRDGFVCLAPTTRVLRADLRYAAVADLQIGDRLVGFDETNPGCSRGGLRAPEAYRRLRIATVTAVARVRRPCYQLVFGDGTDVIASGEHQWLIGSHRSGGRGWRWGRTDALVADRGTQCSWVLRVAPNVDREETHDAGWIGGLFDGEGHLTGSTGWHLMLSQNEGAVLDRAVGWLRAREFDVSVNDRRKCRAIRINGGLSESLRLLMLARPERLVAKATAKIGSGSMSLYGRDHRVAQLVSKRAVGLREVVAVSTDTQTFVAEGLASHNCNAWRAILHDPEATAHHADWPSNENDLHARHAWLVGQRADLTARLEGDPDYCDAKIAGWWLWGAAQWIGSGFCSGDGAWSVVDGKLVHLSNAGLGVSRQRVHLSDAGQGVSRQLVHLGNAGRGVSRQLVHLGNAGRGVDGDGTNGLVSWMRELSERLRRVRVCCGDWSRILTPGSLAGSVRGARGVFLDPPYDQDERAPGLYSVDSAGLAAAVLAWCVEHGANPDYRIALCGYAGEGHEVLGTDLGWTELAWSAGGGMSTKKGAGSGGNNDRERIWFSPHCVRP